MRQSADLDAFLASKTCTSSFLMGGGAPFFATAVTVRVTSAGASGNCGKRSES